MAGICWRQGLMPGKDAGLAIEPWAPASCNPSAGCKYGIPYWHCMEGHLFDSGRPIGDPLHDEGEYSRLLELYGPMDRFQR